MTEAALSLVGVSKRFGRHQALNTVSLTLHPGEVVALLGVNGSGKSTLYNILTGLEKPDTGAVLLEGRDITALPAFGRARLGIRYLPQEPSLFRGLSLSDTLHLVLESHEPEARKREARVADLLHRFDLTEAANRKPASLSGGQQRRGEMACALATEPRFLLVDEPFAKLDPIRITQLASELRALTRHGGARAPGILITDHNIRAALGMADRAVILASGVVIATGPAADILANPEARNAILSPDTLSIVREA